MPREVKLLSRNNPASKKLQVVYLRSRRVGRGGIERGGSRARKNWVGDPASPLIGFDHGLVMPCLGSQFLHLRMGTVVPHSAMTLSKVISPSKVMTLGGGVKVGVLVLS